MSVGERGPTGDHGQMGDPGKGGQPGPKGDKGDSAVTPWVVRQATTAYAILAAGLFFFVLVSQYQTRQAMERDKEVMAAFEAQVLLDEREACSKANEGRREVNRNRDAIRAIEGALRQTFQLVQPRPGASAADRARTDEFRKQILALLDNVKVDGNVEMRDCTKIGNSSNLTTPTTTR